jgi:hypothetical protein
MFHHLILTFEAVKFFNLSKKFIVYFESVFHYIVSQFVLRANSLFLIDFSVVIPDENVDQS